MLNILNKIKKSASNVILPYKSPKTNMVKKKIYSDSNLNLLSDYVKIDHDDHSKSRKSIKSSEKSMNSSLSSTEFVCYSSYLIQDCIMSEDDWDNLINNSTPKNEKINLEESLEYGININQREKIWTYLSNCKNLEYNFAKENVNYYNLLKKKNKKIEHDLDKDIDRTVTEDMVLKYNVLYNKIFDINKMKIKVYNLLKAYAVFDPDIGYAQGTNYIVSCLAFNVEKEENCFWMLISIMNDKGWREIFNDKNDINYGHRKLIDQILNKLCDKMKDEAPEVYEHFSNEDFLQHVPAAIFKYISTIFTHPSVPIEFGLKIFDLFWVKKEDIIIDTLVNLIKLKRNDIVKLGCAELHSYIRDNLAYDCVQTFGVKRCIPVKKLKREIIEESNYFSED